MGRKKAQTDITSEEVAEIYERTKAHPFAAQLMEFMLEEMLEKHPELVMSKLMIRAKRARGEDGRQQSADRRRHPPR